MELNHTLPHMPVRKRERFENGRDKFEVSSPNIVEPITHCLFSVDFTTKYMRNANTKCATSIRTRMISA